jgi:hypothetical protein
MQDTIQKKGMTKNTSLIVYTCMHELNSTDKMNTLLLINIEFVLFLFMHSFQLISWILFSNLIYKTLVMQRMGISVTSNILKQKS